MSTKLKFVFPQSGTVDRLVVWPCTINVPVDGGLTEAQEVTVRFRVIEADRYPEIAKGGDAATFDAIVDGFVALNREDGAIVTDEQGKALFRQLAYARTDILLGYWQMMQGRPAKN